MGGITAFMAPEVGVTFPLYTDLIDNGGNTVLMATKVGVTFIDTLILYTGEAPLLSWHELKNANMYVQYFFKLKFCYICPQIATAEPGRFTQLDYRKADAWSAGALAYEIFGADNPFYNTGQGRLDSRSYRLDELPHLPDDVPAVVQRVVAAREPKKVQY
ncbi:hypothetical protein DPMN_105159 [Dreissena polymorpha]|uniref:non-specific serine/threonine protein kinase n=1 Tax=Dreissena polymorpha TaxID=45954 RepID=A0A9D4HGG3_DREPO|nr:hypothetical protein DPMN_105159 [Dreissena polymorpha]